METLTARIKRLHAETKKTLKFAAELEAIMAKRRAEYARPEWLSVGPRFGKENPYGVNVEFCLLKSRARFLLEDCSALISAANLQGFDDHEGRRSFMLACRLLGLSWSHVEKAIADVSNFGVADASDAWARYLGPSDERIVGKIYVAVAASRPGIVKIGFSKNPAARAKSLSRQHSTPIDIIHDEDGTMLHEWAIHQLLHRASVSPEWYRAAAIPSWLFPVELGGA